MRAKNGRFQCYNIKQFGQWNMPLLDQENTEAFLQCCSKSLDTNFKFWELLLFEPNLFLSSVWLHLENMFWESLGVLFFPAKLFPKCNYIFYKEHPKFPTNIRYQNKKLVENKELDFNRIAPSPHISLYLFISFQIDLIILFVTIKHSIKFFLLIHLFFLVSWIKYSCF